MDLYTVPHILDVRRTVALIGQTLIGLCALRSSVRRLRRPNGLYRSTIRAASGLVQRLTTIDIRRAIAIIGQTLISLCARRSSARRLRRHNGLCRSTIGAASGLFTVFTQLTFAAQSPLLARH